MAPYVSLNLRLLFGAAFTQLTGIEICGKAGVESLVFFALEYVSIKHALLKLFNRVNGFQWPRTECLVYFNCAVDDAFGCFFDVLHVLNRQDKLDNS